MKKLVTLFLAVTLLCCSTFALSGCSDDAVLYKINPTAEEKRVVGTAGNYEILYDELRCITLNYRALMELKYGKGIWDDPSTAEKYREELTEYVLGALVVNSAALTATAKYEISPDDDGVKDYVVMQLNKLANELVELLSLDNTDEDFNASPSMINEYYVQYLQENYLSDRYNRYVMSVDGCVEALRLELMTNGELPADDDSVRKYINENFVHVMHVSIPITEETNADDARQDAEFVAWVLKTNLLLEENRAILREKLGVSNPEHTSDSPAVKFYNRLIDAISTDDKMKILIGSVYNKDTAISKYGYYFSYGEYSQAYEEAAFALADGEISDVVADSTGFYIIQRLPLDESYINANFDNLKAQYQAAYINELIESEQKNISFSFNEFGKTLDLTKIK